jgi:hypothetical protein
VACAFAPLTALRDCLAREWIRDRDFWIDLAKNHHCHHNLWELLPAPRRVATDLAVVLAWARHARPSLLDNKSDVRWITDAVAKFPRLALLADRAVLLNWMPHFFQRTRMLFRDRIPPELLQDKSLWLELLPSLGDGTYAGRHVPRRLRHDPDVVDAQLRRPATKRKMFYRCYSKLPFALQTRFAHRLVAAIESSDCELHVEHKLSRLLTRESDLLCIRKVAHAALCNGYDTESFTSMEAMQASDWARDPASMLSLARRLGAGADWMFWECCSDDLHNDKAFLLEVLKLDAPPPLRVEGDLQNDYDIMCATFAHRDPPGRVPTRGDRDFIRTVRARLQQYVSLETFMAGIDQSKAEEGSRPLHHEHSPAPLSLLRQDRDASSGLKMRMVELLGCVSNEEASVLRRVSLTFAMNGL